MTQRSRAAWIFLVCAAAALAAQTLLIVERQCLRLDQALSSDLRVVFFLRGPMEEGPRQVLEEKLRVQTEAADVRYVSPGQAWAALRLKDPELTDAVALVSGNPLPGAFEVRPAPEALPRLASWIDSMRSAADWSDVRWKPAELEAALRARLYDRWLRLTLSTLLCAAAALALWALASRSRVAAPDGARLAAAGALGAAAGLAAASLAAWPLRGDGLFWAWPSFWAQAAVCAAGAALGWSFSRWASWRGEA